MGFHWLAGLLVFLCYQTGKSYAGVIFTSYLVSWSSAAIRQVGVTLELFPLAIWSLGLPLLSDRQEFRWSYFHQLSGLLVFLCYQTGRSSAGVISTSYLVSWSCAAIRQVGVPLEYFHWQAGLLVFLCYQRGRSSTGVISTGKLVSWSSSAIRQVGVPLELFPLASWSLGLPLLSDRKEFHKSYFHWVAKLLVFLCYQTSRSSTRVISTVQPDS